MFCYKMSLKRLGFGPPKCQMHVYLMLTCKKYSSRHDQNIHKLLQNILIKFIGTELK